MKSLPHRTNAPSLVNRGSFSLNAKYIIPFQPGDPVCLLLKDQLLDKYDSEFAKGVHAQIIWCKTLNMGIDPRYGVGVKYFEPIPI